MGFRAILQVTEESNQSVQRNHNTHTEVQHRRAANEVGRVLHVILQRHNYTNTFQREDHSAEEEWPLHDIDDAIAFRWRRQIIEYINECNHNADKHQNIGDHREGCEVLQIAHQAHYQQRAGNDYNPHTYIQLFLHIFIQHRLHVCADEHQINATTANQIDDEEDIYHETDETRPAIQTGRSVEEGLFGNIGKTHHRYLTPPAKDVRTFDEYMHTVGAKCTHGKGGD